MFLLNYLELLLMIILLGIFFVMSIQPMFMISSMILIVLMYSYVIYISMSGYWFGYALVMVMLSGVLVVFTYMVSLIPNESFENYNIAYMVGLIIFMVGGYYCWIVNVKFSVMSLNLWVSFVGFFNMFMVSFLLMIMLVVVWYSYINYGALRT